MRLRPKNPTSDQDVQLSQSAMEAYFQCPARLLYGRDWSAFTTAQALQDGSDAHAILAGDDVPEASPLAVMYAEALYDLATDNGIEIWDHEVEQVFLLEEGIWFKRIVDGIGKYQGMPIILDWKTSNKGPWPGFRGPNRTRIIPKSMNFQSASYLVPPTDPTEWERFGLTEWPSTMIYVVSDANGHGELVFYNRDAEIEENFRKAAQLVAHSIRNELFPHIRGQVCGLPGTSWSCNYLDLCYQLPGWEHNWRKNDNSGD